MSNLICIHTYGSHRVKNDQIGHKVSAHKIGYTSAASAVLLALYNHRARDVSSKQASYHYIQIDGEVTVRHGYILLKVTDDELTRAESITIRSHRPDVYRWMDGAWHELPNNQSAHYQPVVGRSGPGFNPTGLLIATTEGTKETAAAGIITAEKSQRDGQRDAWWWLHGDTYPHRELLKRHGCRWSKKRRCWYFIGEALPDSVQALIEIPSLADAAPCSDEEAAAILGVDIQPKQQPEIARLFALGEMVYARHDLETPDGKPVPSGTRGTISRLYNRNATHGWSYDVDFAEIGSDWYFERELTSLEPVPGIHVTRGAVVPPGAVPPPTDAEIRQSLIENGTKPEPDNPPAAASAENPPEDAEPQHIRIIRPDMPDDNAEPDAVQTAIQQAKAQPLTTSQHISTAPGKRTLISIPQAYVGELTGSITGNVYCYGYAIHDGICVYLNMGGPRVRRMTA
jgi:hypothetical protein